MSITMTVNGRQAVVDDGATILTACEKAGVKIPTLCHHPDQKVKAALTF